MRNFLFMLLMTSFSVQASITIGAYNIRNFDYDERYRIRTNKPALSNILNSLHADVLSVEEITNSQEFERFVANNLPGYAAQISRCGGRGQHRLGFIYNTAKVELLSFHEDFRVTSRENPGCDTGSRPLAIGLFQIKATGQKFFGITAHLKAGSHGYAVQKRHEQFNMVRDLINELKYKTQVRDYFIAGDLNTTLYYNNGPDFIALNKITKELGMVNVTQNVGCSAYWWGGTDDGIETPTLIDHVLVTSTLIKRSHVVGQVSGHCQLVSCQQVPSQQLGVSYSSVSDHCPITATIQ